jgi:hypothetical protein
VYTTAVIWAGVLVVSVWTGAYALRYVQADPLGTEHRANAHLYRFALAVRADSERHGIKDPDVLAMEVGWLGYYSGGKVHDMLGLVSPEITETPNERKNVSKMFQHRYPDYIVAPAWPDHPTLIPVLGTKRFQRYYKPVCAIQIFDPGTPPYAMFAKQDEKQPRGMRATDEKPLRNAEGAC